MAWRRSFSSAAYCDDAKISSQANVTVSASTYCRAGCNSTSSVSSLYGRCIAFSASEDWTLTEGSFLFKAPTPGIAYTLRFETNRPNGGYKHIFTSHGTISYQSYSESRYLHVQKSRDLIFNELNITAN